MIELIFLGGIHESLGDFVNNRCNLSGFRLCFIYFFLGKYTFDPYSHSKKNYISSLSFEILSLLVN